MNNKLAQKILVQLKNDYDQIAEEFSATRERLWEEFNFFEPYLKKEAKILDVGCGNGRLYDFLKQFKVDYTGLDFSKNLIKESKKRFPDGDFLIGDLRATPLPSSTFDLIFCIASLHHLPSKALRLEALQEIKRLLKPNGSLILTVWNLRQPKYQRYFKKAWWLWFFSFGNYGKNDLFIPWGQNKKVKRYYYAFKPQELRQLLNMAGFTVVEEFGAKKGTKVEFKECFNWCLLAQVKSTHVSTSILGVNVDNYNQQEILQKIETDLQADKQLYAVTPNPEILLKAQEDSAYRNILNQADLSVPDGIGLLWAARLELGIRNKELGMTNDELRMTNGKFLWRWILLIYYALIGLLAIIFWPAYNKKPLSERLSGTDLMRDICLKLSVPVFLLGAKEGIAEKAAEELKTMGAKCEFVGMLSGSPNKTEARQIIDFINNKKPEVLFVAFGAPAQERWIYEHLKEMPSVKLAMGVGGAFDFLAGEVKRAPLLFQKLGIEWLWRLFIQPWRVKRIYNAVVRFPLAVIKSFRLKS